MGIFSRVFSRFASDGADRSPWGSFWFSPVGQMTASGMRVTPDSAMTLAAVYRAVGLVSGHMALLPIKFYKAGTRSRILKHPILRLLNKRPNQYQNAFEWREMIQGHLELRGNAYNEIISNNRGDIVALMPIHPDKVKIEQLDSGEYRYRITNQDGSQRWIARGQMWHIRGLSSNGIIGLSTIEHARESIGMGLAAQGYGARFFANDARPGGWIEFPGNFADKESRGKFRESIQEAQSGQNRGKTLVLDRNMKYHELQLTNQDAQFLESRKFAVTDVARWFGVPPHKIADLDRSTNNNIEQQSLEYIQDGLLPRSVRWSASIEAELLFDDEEIDIEFDFTVLLRGDSASRSNYITKMVGGGIFTQNEGREIEGREPLPGGDVLRSPLNMSKAAGEPDGDEDEDEGDETNDSSLPNKGNQDESGDAARRLRALIHGNAARCARRIFKVGYVDDVELVAAALAIEPQKAADWARNTWTKETFTVENITASLLTLAEAS